MTESTATVREMLDTNVLVYAFDVREAGKHARAVELLRQLRQEGRLILSAQVLNEFYVTVTRPQRGVGMSHDQAAQIIRDFATGCEVLPLTADVTLCALDAIPQHGLSFWDALIWAAAKENGVPVIYTEDFQHGRDIEGVRFVNPFVAQESSSSGSA